VRLRLLVADLDTVAQCDPTCGFQQGDVAAWLDPHPESPY
jgi:hypothetical protein